MQQLKQFYRSNLAVYIFAKVSFLGWFWKVLVIWISLSLYPKHSM